LIDTPGFDDTQLDDSEILKKISAWLLAAYTQTPPMLVNGIIYLQPITNTRMKGTDIENLDLLKALCGTAGLSCIVLATTMWANIERAEGEQRQKELSAKYWSDLVRQGASVVKHEDSKTSALKIIGRIIEKDTRSTLSIQEELLAGKHLQDTDAGRELNKKLIKEREACATRVASLTKEMEDAQARRDLEDMEEVAREQMKFKREMEAKEKEMASLETSLKSLIDEFQRDQKAAEQQRQASQAGVSNLTTKLSAIKKLSQDAEESTKFESIDLTSGEADLMIQLRLQEHEQQMQLESRRHQREMEKIQLQRHHETMEASRKSNKLSGLGVAAGVGSLAVALASCPVQ
jgi:hypothetical protein